MIFSLFKYNLKSNRLLWFSMVFVMSMYYLVILMMYDPKSVNALNEMLKMFPKALIDAMGFSDFGTSLIEFVVGYIYGFLIFMFPMVLVVSLHHKLLASPIEKGSFIAVLSSHHSRVSILMTQLISSWFLVFGFFISTSFISTLIAEIMFPKALDIPLYMNVNLYLMVFYLAISSLLFLISAVVDEGSWALSLEVSLPVLFILIKMLSAVGEKFEWLKFFTLFSLFEPDKMLVKDPFVLTAILILIFISVLSYTLAFIQFNKRNFYL